MRTLWNYLRNYRGLVVLALLLAATNQIFSLLDPLIFRHVIDDYASKFDHYTPAGFFRGVSLLLAAAVGVAFVSRVAKNFQDYIVNTITQRIGARIYADGIRHSLELPYAVFEDQQSGELLGRLQKVRQDVEKLIAASVNSLFTSIVGLVFVMFYAVSVHWVIAPVYALTAPLIGWLSLVLSRRIAVVQRAIVSETTALAGTTTESLRNIELIMSLGLGEQEIQRLNGVTDKILKLELRKIRYVRSLSFVQGTVINFLRTSLLFLLLYLIYARAITFGQFFSLYIYSFFIFGPLQELGSIIGVYREAEVSLEKFDEIMQMPAAPKSTQAEAIGGIRHLEFQDVGFRYPAANHATLSHLSFSLKSGETLAFVGPSGAGKSTLVKLLVGLYTPDSGAIRYNGANIVDLDREHLRSQIGLVTQETQLFAGTIRENLVFVRPNATDEECLEVLHRAACDSLLGRAPSGLDTTIGEGGVKVSGGEKQRLSIARALLRRPALLVFDEATSALDSLTENEITETIRDLSGADQHMTILIAHRLSTIMHADRIYVLEQGNIVEEGKHPELVAANGLYYAMWRQQIGERMVEAA